MIAAKWAFFILYPLIVTLFLALAAVGLALAWFAIPFGTLKREGDKWKMTFPWSEP